jgi:hypothetical protein
LCSRIPEPVVGSLFFGPRFGAVHEDKPLLVAERLEDTPGFKQRQMLQAGALLFEVDVKGDQMIPCQANRLWLIAQIPQETSGDTAA